MKIKKMLSFFISLVLVLSIMPMSDISVMAYDSSYEDYYFQEGDFIYVRHWTEGYNDYVCGYTGENTHLVFPDEMNIDFIASYGGGAKFELNYNVTEITLPKTLKGFQKLNFFPNLEKINILNSDCEFEAEDFLNNTKLKNIDVAEDNAKYCDVDGVLFNKDKTKIIYFPVGREEKVYEIPSTVTEIANRCFNQSTLTTITIPTSVKKIESGAFSGSMLEKIEIPNSVTELSACLSGCKQLTFVKLPNNLNVINGGMFNVCTALEDIAIPDSVTQIKDLAFKGCVALKNVQLSNLLTSVGEGAFYGCSSLETIEIPDSVKSILASAFYNCTNLKQVKMSNNLKYIGFSLFQNCKSLEKIEMPDSLGSISTNAFKNCSSLKSVKLPNSIKEIGHRTFENCTSLKSINIPASVESIGKWAFQNSGLTSITIPKNVKIVYKKAFYGCKNLTSVKFSGKVNNIGRSAFSKCVNLKTVNFTKGYLKKVYDYAFYKCEKLDKITISNTKNVPTIAKSAFNKAKSGIKFYVKNNTVAKKLKAKLQKTNIKKAKIYRSTPILIYKNVG